MPPTPSRRVVAPRPHATSRPSRSGGGSITDGDGSGRLCNDHGEAQALLELSSAGSCGSRRCAIVWAVRAKRGLADVLQGLSWVPPWIATGLSATPLCSCLAILRVSSHSSRFDRLVHASRDLGGFGSMLVECGRTLAKCDTHCDHQPSLARNGSRVWPGVGQFGPDSGGFSIAWRCLGRYSPNLGKHSTNSEWHGPKLARC